MNRLKSVNNFDENSIECEALFENIPKSETEQIDLIAIFMKYLPILEEICQRHELAQIQVLPAPSPTKEPRSEFF